RIEGAQEKRRVKLFTRSGLDWTSRLQPLQQVLQDMPLPCGWYDGEIVVAGEKGLPDFGALQRCFENGRVADIVFYLFDLPYVDGHDLRKVPLLQRRDTLARLLAPMDSGVVRFSAAFE